MDRQQSKPIQPELPIRLIESQFMKLRIGDPSISRGLEVMQPLMLTWIKQEPTSIATNPREERLAFLDPQIGGNKGFFRASYV
jgi:hypothetical protein